jgi:glucose/arabinose dehydrogenase
MLRIQRISALILLVAATAACRVTDESPGGTAERSGAPTRSDSTAGCAHNDPALTLPQGFCATIVADSIGGARHVIVAPNGDVFVQLSSVRSGIGSGGGGITALRDVTGDGRADSIAYFGEIGGTGIALFNNHLYADAKTRIVRHPLPAGSLRPTGDAEVIVANLPLGGHEARNFAVDAAGGLYVNIGSRSNSCQRTDRGRESAGVDPCTELQSRAGIWKFDANMLNQTPDSTRRFATGLRNAMGLAIHPADGRLYATQHGRDQLAENWPRLFDARYSAENPAEVLVQANQGDDFGWPYCYADVATAALVLAPEYGGDGRQSGRCASVKAPVARFPGHWAPMSLLFYSGTQFPERYRGGAFIAFHGSWNRAPEPQDGYRVVFLPFTAGQASAAYETFVDGFAGPTKTPDGARHRPVGLAQGPDGSLYITDDKGGRVWRVRYIGR